MNSVTYSNAMVEHEQRYSTRDFKTKRIDRWWLVQRGIVSCLVFAMASSNFGGLATLPISSQPAEAKVGLPFTPRSAAGVARRTVYRTNIYVARLPVGCERSTIGQTAIWKCGRTYYQAYGNRYVVVTFR